MKTLLHNYGTWILFFVAVLSRLPQLLSEHLLLDGDESIVGLMAKHLYEGKEFPLYFYGQSYGFSLIEILCIDVFYFFFGISDIAVKLGMLCLWTTGVLFFYKTLKQINATTSLTPFLISLVLIFAPAWAAWSMMARGGYLTAFTLSNVCLYLLLHPTRYKNNAAMLFIGFLIVLIYESHALWLPGLLPVVVYSFYKQRKISGPVFFACAAFLTAVLFYFIKRSIAVYWVPPALVLREDLITSFVQVPTQIFYTMTGSYYYKEIIPLNLVTNILAICFTAVIFLGLILALYFLIRKRPYTLLYVFAVSAFLSCIYVVALSEYAPRYLLPLCGFALLMVSELVNKLNNKLVYTALFLPFIGMGIYSLISFKEYHFELQNGKRLKELSAYLNSKNIHYVFCKGALLQWQITFYAKESVIARFDNPTDRYPEYIQRVNAAFNSGRPTAVVHPYNFMPFGENADKVLVSEIYVVHRNVSPEDLLQYGFDPGGQSNK